MHSTFMEFWDLSSNLSKSKLHFSEDFFAYAALDSEKLKSALSNSSEVHPVFKQLLNMANVVDLYVRVFPHHIHVELSFPQRVGDVAFLIKNGYLNFRRSLAVSLTVHSTGTYIGTVIDDLSILSFYPERISQNPLLSDLTISTLNDMIHLESLSDERRQEVVETLSSALTKYLGVLALPMNRYALSFTECPVIVANSSLLAVGREYEERTLNIHSTILSQFLEEIGSENFARNLAWLVVDSFIHDLSWFGIDELLISDGMVYRVGRLETSIASLEDITKRALKYLLLPLEEYRPLLSIFFKEILECCSHLATTQECATSPYKLDKLRSFAKHASSMVLNTSPYV